MRKMKIVRFDRTRVDNDSDSDSDDSNGNGKNSIFFRECFSVFVGSLSMNGDSCRFDSRE